MTRGKSLLAVMATGLLLGACSPTPVDEPQPTDPDSPPPPVVPVSKATEAARAKAEGG